MSIRERRILRLLGRRAAGNRAIHRFVELFEGVREAFCVTARVIGSPRAAL